nr:hypothetical protein [Nocardioides convexus]
MLTKINILREEPVLPWDRQPDRARRLAAEVDREPAGEGGPARRPAGAWTRSASRSPTSPACGSCADFISDAYQVLDMLTTQSDITVRTIKDYIARPKPNGYRSLHAIVEIPVFLSENVRRVPIEPADPHRRDGLLGQRRAQDLLQVRQGRPRRVCSSSSRPRHGSRTTSTSGWPSLHRTVHGYAGS